MYVNGRKGQWEEGSMGGRVNGRKGKWEEGRGERRSMGCITLQATHAVMYAMYCQMCTIPIIE